MRKAILVSAFCAIVSTSCASQYSLTEDIQRLDISFTDPIWGGKDVPDGQQCRRFGGKKARTPELMVMGIPMTADALVVEYGDKSWGSIGAHGKIGYNIKLGTETIVIPSVPAHTFNLPEDFFLVDEHLAPHWDIAGAYLPPCSGGLGHRYYAVVKAIVRAKSENEVPKLMAKGAIDMGRF